GSAKPSFFTSASPFQELARDGTPIGPRRPDVQRGKIYEGGSQLGLQASFGCFADEVLYVGDHIYGDIVKSKKSSGWRTALIVQELHNELRVRRARGMTLSEIASLHALRSKIAEEVTAQRYLARTLGRITPEEFSEAAHLELGASRALLDEARMMVRARVDR